MDSDDEFETGVTAGLKVVNGLNLRELLETGATDFVMDDYIDLNDKYDPQNEEKKRLQEEVDALADLEDTFMKSYGTSIRYQGVDENDQVLSDFDNSYDDMAKNMENVTEDGGIKKMIISPGYGDQIVAGQVVYIHYSVFAEGKDTLVDFSKSHKRGGKKGAPWRLKVGANDVLQVIDIGLTTMQPKEVAKFLAHHDYAYGELGCEPRVPKESRVLVTIEVVGVAEGTIKTNFLDMDPQELILLPFDELYKGIQELKAYGNDAYKDEDYPRAKKQYKLAMKILRDVTTPDERQNILKVEMLYNLLNNIAQCGIKRGDFKSAKGYCLEALNLPSLPRQKKLKAFYRLAKCHNELGDILEAKNTIMTAKTLDPTDEDINKLYDKIVKKFVKDKQDEKLYSQKMFNKE